MLNGNLSDSQCPYCGGLNGSHIWAGSGGCPGTRNLGINPQDMQPLNQIQQNGLQQNGLMGTLGGLPVHVWPTQVVGEDGYEVAKIYREARDRILAELKTQVEINQRLGRELIDLRLELVKLGGQSAVSRSKLVADKPSIDWDPSAKF